MTADAFKQAETRGYAKGYAAGKRRKAHDVDQERKRARETALWQRAMLAAIPFAMEQSTWTRGEKRIHGLAERLGLAADVADEAVNVARGRLRT